MNEKAAKRLGLRCTRYLITKKNPDTGYVEFLGEWNEDTEKREWEDLDAAVRFRSKDVAQREALVYGGKVETA